MTSLALRESNSDLLPHDAGCQVYVVCCPGFRETMRRCNIEFCRSAKCIAIYSTVQHCTVLMNDVLIAENARLSLLIYLFNCLSVFFGFIVQRYM